MRKRGVVGRLYGMKHGSKGHKERSRHKNRIKRSGQARSVHVGTTPVKTDVKPDHQSVHVFDINHNIPTT